MSGAGLIGEIGFGGSTALTGGDIDQDIQNTGGDLTFGGPSSILSISSLAIVGGVILAIVFMRRKK